ncbi:MAG: hypothetical protein KatS3mg115_0264 [Candidatus Poribacteria bacterium]|nr:MAG: hypothetical protein KatS3mg115_0264 [Candidatus Poribacteria bacterium]
MAARGENWKPEGTTAEGDVRRTMHTDPSPLDRFVRRWNGVLQPEAAFAALDAFLQSYLDLSSASARGS